MAFQQAGESFDACADRVACGADNRDVGESSASAMPAAARHRLADRNAAEVSGQNREPQQCVHQL